MSDPTCNGCGRKIQWAKTPAGKNVPLELVPLIKIDKEGVARAVDGEFVLVNHFKTCPQAAAFSGRGRP